MAQYYVVDDKPRSFSQVNDRGLFIEDERMGDGKCEVCDNDKWIVMPSWCKGVKEGGKQYIMCADCLSFSHL